MLTTLNTSYTDTRAADLAWALGREPLPALATLDLELGGARLQLRLLGASHQVLLEEERGSCSETVACIAGSGAPASARGGQAGPVTRDVSFAARVETLSCGSFAGRARADYWPWSPTTQTGSPGSSRQSARLHRAARPAPRGAGPLAYVARLPAGRPAGGDTHEGGGTGDGGGAVRGVER